MLHEPIHQQLARLGLRGAADALARLPINDDLIDTLATLLEAECQSKEGQSAVSDFSYIESNPVRAGMVALRSDCRRSSHAANAAGRHDPLVSQHPAYQALGATASQRQLAYHRVFDTPAAADEVDTIRLCLQRQHALGSSPFKDAIERQLARRVGPAKVGRPRKPRQGAETAL